MHGDVTEHVGGMPGDAMTGVVRQRVGIDPTSCRLRISLGCGDQQTDLQVLVNRDHCLWRSLEVGGIIGL